jgi:hypothetical protein
MIVTETGYLEGFGRVHASKKAMANVLSFTEVEDKMAITYLPGRGFVVHNKERDILFARSEVVGSDKCSKPSCDYAGNGVEV